MALSELAAGLEVTSEQRDPGVAAVDDTGSSLAERLAPLAGELPCGAAAAATVVERYAAGEGIEECSVAAGLAPVTAARTLHLLGEPIEPLSPTGREVVADFVAGELSRADALALTGVGESEFALAVYVATHDPLPGAREAVDGALAVEPADPLADARSAVDDLL